MALRNGRNGATPVGARPQVSGGSAPKADFRGGGGYYLGRKAPRGAQQMASLSRSSPQKISRPTTKVGEPNTPNSFARSVADARSLWRRSPRASAITRSAL